MLLGALWFLQIVFHHPKHVNLTAPRRFRSFRSAGRDKEHRPGTEGEGAQTACGGKNKSREKDGTATQDEGGPQNEKGVTGGGAVSKAQDGQNGTEAANHTEVQNGNGERNERESSWEKRARVVEAREEGNAPVQGVNLECQNKRKRADGEDGAPQGGVEEVRVEACTGIEVQGKSFVLGAKSSAPGQQPGAVPPTGAIPQPSGVPPGRFVSKCTACLQRYTFPLASKDSFVRCQKCRAAFMAREEEAPGAGAPGRSQQTTCSRTCWWGKNA